MPELEIYFSGLICHVGPSELEGSDRAAIVRSILLDDGPYHTPRIRTSMDAADSGLGVPLNTGVTFTDLGYVATAKNLFQDTVPHLDDLTHSGVKFYKNPRGLIVQLPAGDFTVVEFYDYGAIWTLDDDINIRPCVPRVTMLSTSGNDPVVSFNGRQVPLIRDGWILITNLETGHPNTYKQGDDWKKQHNVTTGNESDIADYTELKPPIVGFPPTLIYKCRRPASGGTFSKEVLPLLDRVALADSSECTNSHWP